mmetsp:Transcript_1095/g.1292  ORF Transcript_1095/g.1292 Transcript_1095/m.1292 type:complete len:455 (-) Transcript_1095:295-1659(-)
MEEQNAVEPVTTDVVAAEAEATDVAQVEVEVEATDVAQVEVEVEVAPEEAPDSETASEKVSAAVEEPSVSTEKEDSSNDKNNENETEIVVKVDMDVVPETEVEAEKEPQKVENNLEAATIAEPKPKEAQGTNGEVLGKLNNQMRSAPQMTSNSSQKTLTKKRSRRTRMAAQTAMRVAGTLLGVVVKPVTIIRRKFYPINNNVKDNTPTVTVKPQSGHGDVEQLHTGMVDLWEQNIFDTITLSDLPRLIDRVTVQNGRKDILVDPWAYEFSSRKKTAVYIGNVTKTIAEVLEDDDDAENVVDTVDSLLDELPDDTESDLVSFCTSLVEAVGEDSRAAKIFQCFNQAVIAKCSLVLRQVILGKHFTKDVRGPNGWRILITVGDYVQVRHTRREQSLTQGDNHWEFEWEVSLTFDREMKELTNTRLLITKLELSDTMDKALEEEIASMMQNGSLMVS